MSRTDPGIALARFLASADGLSPDARVLPAQAPFNTSVGPLRVLSEWEASPPEAWVLYRARADAILEFLAKQKAAS